LFPYPAQKVFRKLIPWLREAHVCLCLGRSPSPRRCTVLRRSRRLLSIDIFPRSAEIECILHFLSSPKEEEQVERIVAAFRNEVLDQDLRAIIARETEATRNAILAFALSKTGLQGSE